MLEKIIKWSKANSSILVNAGSLISANVTTSALGFAYWWVAARRFMPTSVGVASASISAKALLGSFCVIGLGTLLITELPRQPGNEGKLISTAITVVGSIGLCVGAVFAISASHLASGFRELDANFLDVIIFAVGVCFSSMALVLDQSLVGLLLGKMQLWRNMLFASSKLIFLFVISFWLAKSGGIVIFATWSAGNVFSLLTLLTIFLVKKGWPGKEYLPKLSVLRKLGRAAVQHHMLNITLQLPTSALPVLVTVVLSAKMNAWFYVSWTMVGFIFYVPVALTMVLHAMNSAQQSTLARKARSTISISLAVSILAVIIIQIMASKVLAIFGSSYAENATWTLRILVLAAFPLVIKNHFISICRIFDRLKFGMFLIAPGSFAELCVAALGGHFGGLVGLSIGWVAAVYIEALFMFPTVYKALVSSPAGGSPTTSQDAEEMAIWLLDTLSMPVISSGYLAAETLHSFRAVSLPTTPQPAAKWSVPELDIQLSQHGRLKYRRLRPFRLQPYDSHSALSNPVPVTDSQHGEPIYEDKVIVREKMAYARGRNSFFVDKQD